MLKHGNISCTSNNNSFDLIFWRMCQKWRFRFILICRRQAATAAGAPEAPDRLAMFIRSSGRYRRHCSCTNFSQCLRSSNRRKTKPPVWSETPPIIIIIIISISIIIITIIITTTFFVCSVCASFIQALFAVLSYLCLHVALFLLGNIWLLTQHVNKQYYYYY